MRKTEIVNLVSILIVAGVVLSVPILEVGASGNEHSPLYDLRLNQAVEGMYLLPDGASMAGWNYGSMDVETLKCPSYTCADTGSSKCSLTGPGTYQACCCPTSYEYICGPTYGLTCGSTCCSPTSYEYTCGTTCCSPTSYEYTCGSTCCSPTSYEYTCGSTCCSPTSYEYTCGSTCCSPTSYEYTCGATYDYTCCGPTCYDYTCCDATCYDYTCGSTCCYTCPTPTHDTCTVTHSTTCSPTYTHSVLP